MKFGILILAAFTAFAGSCAPVHSVKRYGISATLTDQTTHKPISKTPVVITIDDKTFKRTTDQEGAASVGPDRKLRMSWLGGPAIQSDPEARITVSCTGYCPLDIEWFRSLPHRNSGRIEEMGVIELGKLEMTKTEGMKALTISTKL